MKWKAERVLENADKFLLFLTEWNKYWEKCNYSEEPGRTIWTYAGFLDKKISFYSNNQIIERRSPSTKRRYEENYITEERYSSGDVIQDDGDLRAYNGVVYREAPSRHSGGHYRVHGSERRSRSRSGRRERGSDDDVEVVYGKEYVVER